MNKKELLSNGYKHIATNHDEDIEVYAKFRGYKDDEIQYYYYDSINDSTIDELMTTTYKMIDLFKQMEEKLRTEFFSFTRDYNNFFISEEN